MYIHCSFKSKWRWLIWWVW